MRELSYSSLVKIKAILIIHVKYVVYNQESRDSEDYKHASIPIRISRFASHGIVVPWPFARLFFIVATHNWFFSY
jgi:hypothetical protein